MKLTEWEEINFASSTYDRGFIFRIYKRFKNKKQKTLNEDKEIQVKCGP